MKTKIQSCTKKVYADQITPIAAYLNVRGDFPCSFLLESSEISDEQQARSIICANPIAGIRLDSENLTQFFKSGKKTKPIAEIISLREELNVFFSSFEIDKKQESINGFFGFQSFEAVRYFETKKANLCSKTDDEIAIVDYRLFQYVLCFNHFNGEITFIENMVEGEKPTLDKFVPHVLNKRSGVFPFSLQSEETVETSAETYLKNVKKAQEHCQRGDVFQMVLSRKFHRKFNGDEFNVYRALRHVNPSPYMFFFDYGSYKIFGSSPEAQLRVSKGEASINPIAGTYKRTGNKAEDERAAKLLSEDKKELAEHAMLVDLARNDLNRHCENVHVSQYKELKKYSHVIHMVSTVKGKLKEKANPIDVLADTFPAGTLSGAPKVRALQLLAEMENDPRGFYGGSIGFVDFNGDINQAIIIRSFLSKNNRIFYRAGAGIVLKSVPENELKEVDNKLAALRKALIEAGKI